MLSPVPPSCQPAGTACEGTLAPSAWHCRLWGLDGGVRRTPPSVIGSDVVFCQNAHVSGPSDMGLALLADLHVLCLPSVCLLCPREGSWGTEPIVPLRARTRSRRALRRTTTPPCPTAGRPFLSRGASLLSRRTAGELNGTRLIRRFPSGRCCSRRIKETWTTPRS